MKATEAKFIDFLKKSPQFVIPIYQRTYSWTERECKQIWDDIMRTGSNDKITAHFVGSIVYIERGLYQVTGHTPLLVIDGQQRLTTVTLLITALANALTNLDEENREPLDGFSPRKLRNYYLLNPEESGERHYKLILSQTDRDTLTAIVSSRAQPGDYSIRVAENFKLFESWIAGLNGNLLELCKGLAKLVVVDISLNRDQDNPQLIFESMNSTGLALTQADLIRNYILMSLEQDLQTKLYQDYWRPMELDFGQEAYSTHFDGFMRNYLTLKTGVMPKFGEVYEAFKGHASAQALADASVEDLVADIRTFARYFCAVVLGKEADPQLKRVFHDLRELRIDVVYPFILELYHDYVNDVLSKDDLVNAVRFVEAYVFRRAVCAIPTNSMNKTFATFNKSLRKDRYLESIQAHFLKLPSYRRFPNDDEFQRELQVRDLYNFRICSYWLRRLENHNRKERVPVDEYTIEHILPQNENLSGQWKKALGPDWERIQKTYLHTLGNLTLTGYNSEYSDHPFEQKRDMKGGFKDSPLKVNNGLSTLDAWNEDSIRERAERLAESATHVWVAPSLPTDVLDGYRPKKEQTETYTIDDHPNLDVGTSMRQLFEVLRKEILALDPCVVEEFLKRYVAYNAESKFVHLVPTKNHLRMALNLEFGEIEEPEELSRKLPGLAERTNGKVRVTYASLHELPFVMGLIRYAFEKQMENDIE